MVVEIVTAGDSWL